MKALLQRGLLAAYRAAHATGILSTPLGRRTFLRAYAAYKSWFDPSIDPLRAFVREGGWIVDVGANVGHFTLTFARWTGGGGKVLALEPEPDNVAALRDSVSRAGLGDGVEVVAGAAAERTGIAHLRLNPHNPADHRLAQAGVPVSLYTLDGLIAERGDPPVSLIKIDVQGAEPRVIAGAEEVLRRCRPALFIEIDDAALTEAGSSAAALLQQLDRLGYRPSAAGEPARRLSPADVQAACQRLGYADFLFLHESR